jgi:GntR family transcriptional regulator/MocR family aminotransferase
LAAATGAKAAADLGGPVVEQLAFARLLASGGYDRHLRRARRVYRRRRDAVVRALGRHLPQARVSGVAAGLHLVVELPAGSDDVAVVEAARAVGLGPLPLSRLRLRPGGRPGLVIGYAAHSPDELEAAVQRLAESAFRADSGQHHRRG